MDYDFEKLNASAMMYGEILVNDLKKRAKSWKSYQELRQKQGKNSPDWTHPNVRLAYIRPINENISPYSYE